MQTYKEHVGYKFDLENPVTFLEKIQWYKFNLSHPRMTEIVDKYLFKSYIKEMLGDGWTIPLYGAWTSVEDFSKAWESLPEKFCLKSTVQSDGNFIKIIEKSKTNLDDLCSEIKGWLDPFNTLVNSFCRAYHDATPRILAEEYMESIKDQLYDYKIFCFNGVPFCNYVAQDHFGKDGSHISFYDMEWKKLDVKYGNHLIGDAQKPKHYEEMVQISSKLSKDFPFIRVDFFDTDEKLYIAELTFYPGGGLTQYYPVSFNEELGKLFVLDK